VAGWQVTLSDPTNYQWLPENYIINGLFPVPFSNTVYVYDDSFLVLGTPSVFCVLKFLCVLSLFLIRVHMFFPLLCRS